VFFISHQSSAQRLLSITGSLSFTSDAPLERISASSKAMRTVVDLSKNEFAVSIPMKTFVGFNSPLQKEHFHENYLETNRFPTATFTGKIIEQLDFVREASGTFRAKGQLDIHGVKQERIIKCKYTTKGGQIFVNCDFEVLLEDHQISIPRIVHQKIAEKILVHLEMTLNLR
jgi:hypothetical protein